MAPGDAKFHDNSEHLDAPKKMQDEAINWLNQADAALDSEVSLGCTGSFRDLAGVD